MILECSHCGAPLDVKEGVSIFACRYCGAKNERQRARTIAETTPRNFAPPRQWTPPSQFAADSNVQLNYRSSSSSGAAGIAVAVVIMLIVGVVIFVSVGHGSSGTLNVEPDKVVHATLDKTPDQLAKELSGNGSEGSAYIPLHSDRYNYLSVSWDAKDSSHPQGFYLAVREGQKPDTATREAIAKKLRGGFDDDGQWRWERISVTWDKKTGSLSSYVDTNSGKNIAWKKQFEAAWKLVLGIAFGIEIEPTAKEMQDYLGNGYPIASLLKLSSKTTVDTAFADVTKLFPGAVDNSSSGVALAIPIDHPIFMSAEVDWPNERGATLRTFDFKPVGGQKGFASKRETLATCLGKVWGPPSVTDGDYIRKIKNYDFKVGKQSVYLGEYDLSMRYASDKPTDVEWIKIINGVDGCR